jgi:Tc toxin complex TcA C-terminal TcB-binding domain
MRFATPMALFDHDFPGHYLRLIKRVRTSVIALIPPTEGIRAVLSTTGLSNVVIGSNGLYQKVPVRRSPDSVALTSPINASGVFELTPQPGEMLLPFEGMGVETAWELRMPKASNPFDYRPLADVLITFDYTALDSFDYRQQVIQELDQRLSGDRPFSFRQEFADAWYDLHNPEQTATPMVVSFRTRRQDFPPNLDDLKIQHVVLYFSRVDGTFEAPVDHLRFTEAGGVGTVGGGATSIDGLISTRKGNAGSWTAMLGKSPIGDWELALPNTGEMKNRFRDEEVDDILLVVTYRGETPPWPK